MASLTAGNGSSAPEMVGKAPSKAEAETLRHPADVPAGTAPSKAEAESRAGTGVAGSRACETNRSMSAPLAPLRALGALGLERVLDAVLARGGRP